MNTNIKIAQSSLIELRAIIVLYGLHYVGYINPFTNYNCVIFNVIAVGWKTIRIGSSNNNLTNATRYYYSESQPTSSGNYWHYDENGNVVKW